MAHLLLYGGTFDPIHLGHLIPCRQARALLNADQVILIPARISPFKTAPTTTGIRPSTAEERLTMIQLAIQSDPEFAIDSRELSRPGPSYTVDTLEDLSREKTSAHSSDPRLTLLLGADQLPMFHGWRNITRILELAHVAVMPRPGIDAPSALLNLTHRLPTIAPRIQLLDTPLFDISATDIRRRVATGLPIDTLVPPSVADFINHTGLYRPQT